MNQDESSKQEEPTENEEEQEETTTQSRVPLSDLQEADEVYERMEELTIEVAKASERVDEIDAQLKALREGIAGALAQHCDGHRVRLHGDGRSGEYNEFSQRRFEGSLVVEFLDGRGGEHGF